MDEIANKSGRRKTARAISAYCTFEMSVRAIPIFSSWSLLILLAALSLMAPAVSAADLTHHVLGGGTNIDTVSPTTSHLVQASGATILNWNSFSLVTHSVVSLFQPSVHSVALNRLIGTDKSVILGRLRSDSQIVLINPHKYVKNVLGDQEWVNTGEFLATTIEIREEDVPPSRGSSISNSYKVHTAAVHGESIQVSEQGYVTLVAPGVSQEGVIVANLGTVPAESGRTYTLDLMSDGLINYTITKQALSQVAGLNDKILADPMPDKGGVGQVILNANAAEDIITSVVNSGGISRARHLVNRDGILRLESSDAIMVSTRQPDSAPQAFHSSGRGTVVASNKDKNQKPQTGETVTPDVADTMSKPTVLSNPKNGKVNLYKQEAKTRQGSSRSMHSNSRTPPNHPLPRWMSLLDFGNASHSSNDDVQSSAAHPQAR